MSITDMVDLVLKIREISRTKLTNPIDIAQMKEWTDRVEAYSRNLRQAGLAMERARQMAMGEKNSRNFHKDEFNQFYSQAAHTIYQLGEAINLERRTDKPPNLDQAYKEVLKEQGQEKIDSYLFQGLQYARFGERDRGIDQSPTQAFESMIKLYHRVSEKQTEGMIEQMVDTVVTRSIPHHTEATKTAYTESQTQSKEIPGTLAEEVVLRGIERAYKKLPIPPAIKQLMEISDIEGLDKPSLTNLCQTLDSQMGITLISNNFARFVDHDDLERLGFLGNDSYKGWINQSSTQILSKVGGEETIKKMFSGWQEQLKTLGLGKKNIETFSQWLEDPTFFSKEKIEELYRQTKGLTKVYSWVGEHGDSTLKNIREVKEYYDEKIRQGEEIKDEYADFQKAMLRMIITQMRLNYGGWVNKDRFSELQDTSPSTIVNRMQLNCVGRSNILLVAGDMLGLQGFGIISFGHVETAFEFVNRERLKVDPSNFAGGEFEEIKKVNDTHGLLRDGEEVWDSIYSRYLLIGAEKSATHGVLTNFDVRNISSPELRRMTEEYVLDATTLHNFFLRKIGEIKPVDIDVGRKVKGIKVTQTIVDIASVAKIAKKHPEEIRELLRRLQFLAPGYMNYLLINNIDYYYKMDKLMREIAKSDSTPQSKDKV